MSEPLEAGSEDQSRPLLREPVWWAAFVVLFALMATWTFATPLFAVNDEPAHVVKAAAVARGELSGKKVKIEDRPGELVRGGFTTIVHVPYSYTFNTSEIPNCYIFDNRVSAECAPAFEDNPKDATWTTWVGRQPPTFYLLVGWSTLLDTGTTGIYVMRLLNALMCSALLATALVYCRALRRFRVMALGVMLAATPMVLFLGGAVNPSGLEIAAAICLWVCLIVAAQQPGEIPKRLLISIGVSGALFAFIRPMSTFWLALIVVAAVLLLPDRRRLVELWNTTAARVVAGAIALVSVAAIAWTFFADALGNVAGEDPRGLGFFDAVEHSLSRVDVYVKEMIGVFGWRTTPAPDVVHVLWLLMIGAVVVLALWLGTTRIRLLLLGLGAASLFVPAIIEGFNAETNGFAWQGRYALPLAVGIPIVATLALGSSGRLSAVTTKRMAAAIVVLAAVLHVYVHLYVTRRYVVGTDGPTFYFGKDGWSPPLPVELLALVTLAGAAALALLTYRLVTSDEPIDVRRLLPTRRSTEPATA